MVINVSYVGDVGPKLTNYAAKLMPRLGRVNEAWYLGDAPPTGLRLEIDVRNEVPVIGRRLAARVRHGKECDLVSMGTQQIHQFEQVDFCATESEVIFVAE
jgi:hypothetical protein